MCVMLIMNAIADAVALESAAISKIAQRLARRIKIAGVPAALLDIAAQVICVPQVEKL